MHESVSPRDRIESLTEISPTNEVSKNNHSSIGRSGIKLPPIPIINQSMNLPHKSPKNRQELRLDQKSPPYKIAITQESPKANYIKSSLENSPVYAHRHLKSLISPVSSDLNSKILSSDKQISSNI